MASDDLVERVARALRDCAEDPMGHVPMLAGFALAMPDTFHGNYAVLARAAIEALSTPEFVLPLAEEMLRKAGTHEVSFYGGSLSLGAGSVSLRDGRGVCTSNDESLIEAYRALLVGT